MMMKMKMKVKNIEKIKIKKIKMIRSIRDLKIFKKINKSKINIQNSKKEIIIKIKLFLFKMKIKMLSSFLIKISNKKIMSV